MIDTTRFSVERALGRAYAITLGVFLGDTYRERGRRKRAVTVEAIGFQCRVRWAHDGHVSEIAATTLMKRFAPEPP